ncbi:Animal heme peroxidase [Pelagimonas phthalicica]|uniref:Animal heme peroxidase n=1 Tax=Pelagimonas phthalicica TaxID=1037362 RepID=A0A238JBK4_9RHOB|nr:peroxidase family protein [Pelagimonas phthalicica]TDS94239.1 heme peroxidase [Pelagimonas phthalicica]SMX27236.1 Animal heme peroxidase [Pelagimonas phthalicica]
MLVSFRHGQHIPITDGQEETDCSSFDYFFKTAAEAEFGEGTLLALDAVHQDMVESDDPSDKNHSSLPPIFTYFGQFVDHDITGLSQRDDAAPLPEIDGPFEPQSRNHVLAKLINTRTGRFDLDSLYGSERDTGNASLNKLNGLLRFPKDRAMMWIGTYGNLDRRVRFPENDPGGDLLRLDHLLKTGAFTEGDIEALPAAHRALFMHPDGSLNRSRAIIADARNDENLFIAQLHLAFLRFHNRVVQEWPHARKAGDENEVFEWARHQVRLYYQWLVLNIWLPAICDPKVVREILSDGPKLYDALLNQCHWNQGDPLPMPLEFATACFRFGHSMVRGTYDWNENFGRGPSPLIPSGAAFEFMFLFTGSVPKSAGDPANGIPPREPMGGNGPKLPGNWGADWDRLVHPLSQFADRSTRRIDTVLADPLTRMENEKPNPIARNLLARNVRRGFLHNLPTAQSAINGLEALGMSFRKLTKAEICSGRTSGEIKSGGFDDETPLWFYTLKEAELLGSGQHLGPLGSHIVAGTIIGLILRGPNPVWETPGSHEGRWHPVDGPRVSGQLVDSFPALLRAALLMENPDH